MYTLGQAAKAAGRSKSSVHRAIVAGRLSAIRTADGTWSIDPAEVDRVFRSANGQTGQIVTGQSPAAELAAARALAAERLEMLRDLREVIRSIQDEKRTLLALLTDRRPWWRRWIR